MTDVRELLPLYALGVLDVLEQQAVDRAASQDPAIAAELASYMDTAASLIGEPSAVEPPAEIKAQLMASAGAGRYEPYANRLAVVYDVTVDRAREILGLIERKKSWELPAPGVGLVHFDGGHRYANADCGFVRIDPGCAFPYHRHRGEELTVILSGHLREPVTGRVLGPGEELVLPQDTEHEIRCEGNEPVVFAARVIDGIEIGGQSLSKPGRR